MIDKKTPIFLIVLLLSSLLYLVNALADGCSERHATSEEKDFQVKNKAAIRKAMPSAPPGWQIIREDKVDYAGLAKLLER